MKALMNFLNENKVDGVVDFSCFDQFNIKATKHPEFDIYKLNYSQLNSPKMNPIVQDCRGTIVDKFGNPVAVSFSRFFNLGEAEEITSKFDWSNFTCQSKEDGSLIILYWYNNQWNVSTRGSFATGQICEGSPTWSELVFDLIGDRIKFLHKCDTYIFELCSLYNKVVREYKTPTLYLLTSFESQTNEEYSFYNFYFDTPIQYHFKSLEEAKVFIRHQEETDPTFEGLVVKDCNGLRLKIKSSTYISLHQLKGNGSITSTKNILPFILANETDEVISYFPEMKPRVDEVKAMVDELYNELTTTWMLCTSIENQKDFAIAIKDCRMRGLLFDLRKQGKLNILNLHHMFRESSELIIKLLKDK